MQRLQYTLIICFTVATSLLIIEWYKVRCYAYELLELKEDYQAYVEQFKKKVARETLFDDECSVRYDEFMVLSRNLDYLKNSALSYVGLFDELDNDEVRFLYDQQDLAISNESNAPARSRSRVLGAQVRNQQAKTKNQIPKAQSLMAWPLDNGTYWQSSQFGPRKKADGSPGFHQGLDLAAAKGTRVKAGASGVVVEAGKQRGYGNTIVVMHNRKYKTRYAHLDKIFIKRGQKIDRGQVIGAVGNTGLVRSNGGDGSHLHFEVYVFGKRVNPRHFLP